MTTYDRKTTPLRPARVITVSGPVDRALSTIVSAFTVRKFRVTTPAGVSPIKLELGRGWVTVLLFLSNFLFTASRQGVVGVRVETRTDDTVALTVLVQTAWSARTFTPIFLSAVDDAVTAFNAAGVLVVAGPVVNAKSLR